MDRVTFSDSKYTVADILSSMASGQPLTPTLSTNFSVINTMGTPTLTPTTLASLERSFIEMPHAQDLTVPRTRSGFVPPVIDPVSSMEDDPDWMPVSGSKRTRTSAARPAYSVSPYQVPTPAPRRGGGRKSKDDPRLAPEELRRRQVRRERNKHAAAKCRQRRVDHTNELVMETEELEEETSSLESQIKTLQQQKEQLEFLLQAHKPMCKAAPKLASDDGHVEEKASRPQSLPILKPVVVKQEPEDSSEIGIPITTPSTGMFSFSLDSFEGRTGLTPMSEGLMKTGLTPTCSAQQRNSSDSSPDVLNSPTLISL